MKFKTIKHINEPGCIHELTFSCFQNQSYFASSEICYIVIDKIDKARSRLKFLLIAYVIMPDHIHLLIHPNKDRYSISNILSAIKLPVSVAVSNLMKKRTGKYLGALWQRGGGYDRNIYTKKALLASINYIHGNPVRKELVASPEDWKWSSASFYLGMPNYLLKMDNEILEILI